MILIGEDGYWRIGNPEFLVPAENSQVYIKELGEKTGHMVLHNQTDLDGDKRITACLFHFIVNSVIPSMNLQNTGTYNWTELENFCQSNRNWEGLLEISFFTDCPLVSLISLLKDFRIMDPAVKVEMFR